MVKAEKAGEGDKKECGVVIITPLIYCLINYLW